MMIHTGRVTLHDRIALSSLLYEIADRFADEATRWSEGDIRDKLERGSRHLAELARHTLIGTVEYQRAEAFADAGETLIDDHVAARRLIEQVHYQPNRETR